VSIPKEARGHLLLAAILAPTAGLLAIMVALVLYAWMFRPVEDLFGGRQEVLFYLLLLGAGASYLLEFVGLWLVRTLRGGRALPLPALLLLSTCIGGSMTPVVVHRFIPLGSLHQWLGAAALGVLGGLVAGFTFWAVAPEGA
jgi:hypothetical protein